jgi:hypothetical protein
MDAGIDHMMDTWTEDAVATLRERWAAGDSAGDIAAALGVSRNSVIGKASRLGLARHVSRPNRVWAIRRRLGLVGDVTAAAPRHAH